MKLVRWVFTLCINYMDVLCSWRCVGCVWAVIFCGGGGGGGGIPPQATKKWPPLQTNPLCSNCPPLKKKIWLSPPPIQFEEGKMKIFFTEKNEFWKKIANFSKTAILALKKALFLEKVPKVVKKAVWKEKNENFLNKSGLFDKNFWLSLPPPPKLGFLPPLPEEKFYPPPGRKSDPP